MPNELLKLLMVNVGVTIAEISTRHIFVDMTRAIVKKFNSMAEDKLYDIIEFTEIKTEVEE